MLLTHKNTALVGAIFCLLAVAIGAFGAHALRDLLDANQRQDVFELANRYQFYHGLALLGIAALYKDSRHSLKLLLWFMTLGVIIFSGSLYALALSNLAWLGAITPVGGLLLITAWLYLIVQLFKAEK